MIVTADTTVADIDEALLHLTASRDQAGPVMRTIIERRVDTLLDARNALAFDHA